MPGMPMMPGMRPMVPGMPIQLPNGLVFNPPKLAVHPMGQVPLAPPGGKSASAPMIPPVRGDGDMSSAMEAMQARAKQAAEDEARELNKMRASQDKGEVMAGPSMKPFPGMPQPPREAPPDTDSEPPAKARKLDNVLDGVGPDEGKKEKKLDDGPDESQLARPKWFAKIKQAQWWYYQDALKSPQGPFYPGQMRDWFTQGYFSQDHPVAPSFQGEMPQIYARIVEAFPHPVYETAFVPGGNIANYPPEEQVIEVKREVTKEELIKSLMQATPGQEFQKSAISFN